LVILVSETLVAGFSPAAQAQQGKPGDYPADAYNTVPPQAGYWCPMGTGYPYLTDSPQSGHKARAYKRGGYPGARYSDRQGYSRPHRMGCNWY
jgi:hypothetical protein